MTEYALLIGGVFREFRQLPETPADIPHKGVTWHEVVREEGEAFEGLQDGKWIIRIPSPPPPAPVVPASISPRQVRLLLNAKGLLASVEAMIAQQSEAVRIEWEFASEFRRDNPLLLSLAASPALNLTPAQIDAFFIEAAAL